MLKYITPILVVYLVYKNLVSGEPLSGEPLSSFLWRQTQQYHKAALDSKYIRAIRDVTLDPNDFGAYNLQDAVYIYWFKISMDISASRTNDTVLKEFLKKKSKSHETEYKEAFKTWHISDPRGIELGKACQKYVDHLVNVSKTMDGFYLVAALIPCSRLWPWLGKQINSDSGKFGIYNNWVQVNLNQSYVGYTTYEKVINDAFAQGKMNKDKALQAYEASMKGEVDFFNSVEYKEAFKTWHISDPRGIELGKACQKYVDHLVNVSKTMDGFYLVAALIPCSRLWPWLGKQINSDSGKFGIYNNWVQVNLNQSYVGYTTYEKVINDAFAQGKMNKDKALQAYEASMKGEVDFFNSVEYKEAFKTWHISDPRGIELGKACQKYVDHLVNVSKTMDGFYLVAALIPCSRLWPWLGKQINSDSGKFGIYNNWVQVNLNQSYVGYTTYEKVINDAFAQGKMNKDKALQAYEASMKGEVDFFNSV